MSPFFEAEEFWDDLLAYIEERQVIPVVGGELIDVSVKDISIPLYRAVAEKLLERYGMAPAPIGGTSDGTTIVLRPFHELNDAVYALSRSGQKRIQDLYRPVNDCLKAVLDEQKDFIPKALKQLAEIANFDLLIATTCDDLLQRAINKARFNGAGKTELIEFAPNLSSDKVRDIPEIRPKGYAAVFHIFGKASALPQFAIHDEDILEYVYSLHTGRGYVPERILAAVRSRNLLLIGCNFSDWLCRFFIRGTNQTRLSGDRSKKEFLVETVTAQSSSLTLFLERFSQNTRVYPGTATEFVQELYTRWIEKHPRSISTDIVESETEDKVRRGDIFVSYCSADRPAARLIVEAIERIGGSVVWFDRHDLTAGDDWQKTILSMINRCNLFIPLISQNTENRKEGFFHVEWDEACNRDRKVLGRKFIMPVVINDTPSGADDFLLIPDCFKKYQFSHAPGGEPTERFLNELKDEIREMRRARTQ